MASGNGKIQCFSCNKQTRTLNCGGCLKDFCMNCLPNHFQMLNKQFEEIEYQHDIFRQILLDENKLPKYCELIKEIDQWEMNSIEKIKTIANDCRVKTSNVHRESIHVTLDCMY